MNQEVAYGIADGVRHARASASNPGNHAHLQAAELCQYKGESHPAVGMRPAAGVL